MQSSSGTIFPYWFSFYFVFQHRTNREGAKECAISLVSGSIETAIGHVPPPEFNRSNFATNFRVETLPFEIIEPCQCQKVRWGTEGAVRWAWYSGWKESVNFGVLTPFYVMLINNLIEFKVAYSSTDNFNQKSLKVTR